MMKTAHILIACLLISSYAGAQEAVLKASFDRDSIMIGEQVQWTLKATVDRSIEAFFPVIDSITDGRIELLKNEGLDTLQTSSNNITIQHTYIITSFDEGIYTLPEIPLLLRHRDGKLDTAYFERLSLLVKTVPIDTTTFEPYDIKTPITYPLTFMEVLPWALSGLAVLALIALTVYIIIRRRQHKPIFFKPKPKEPPHVVALRELDKIKADKLWQNNKVKLYYTRVTDVLRIYMEERYSMQAMEQTSEEILQALKSMPLSDGLTDKLRELLSVSDLVKFAKYQPMTDENEKALATAQEFVDETKEEIHTEENTKQQRND
ncbi:MAG: transmembrane domain-containing protein [Prevotellaceae bacterium]|jgi:hypothetical protein|nr:transmembrane domain-containing protein [Prevotellaceae bacterium]